MEAKDCPAFGLPSGKGGGNLVKKALSNTEGLPSPFLGVEQGCHVSGRALCFFFFFNVYLFLKEG